MTAETTLAALPADAAASIVAAFDRLESDMQRLVVFHHLDRGDVPAALLVLAAPPELYRPHDRLVMQAFLLGILAAFARR